MSEKCAIRLFRVRGQKIGAGNDANAAIYLGYSLKACLTLCGRTDVIDEVTFPLAGGPREGDDRWRDIRLHPKLIGLAVKQLSAKARKLGFRVVEVRDHQDDPRYNFDGYPYGPSWSKLVSARKLFPSR